MCIRDSNNTAALITGEETTLTITADSSSYGGSFGGTVTVDYTGGGTFTLGNSDKSAALTLSLIHISSLNILIKLMSMLAIVTAGVNIAVTLF